MMMISRLKQNQKYPGADEEKEECTDYVKEDEDNENN